MKHYLAHLHSCRRGKSQSITMSRQRNHNYCITINNYSEEELAYCRANPPKDVQYIGFELETGDNGTPHIQGFVHYTNAVPFNTVKKHFPRAHIEAMRGSLEHNTKYCSKEGKLEQYGNKPKSMKEAAKQSAEERWALAKAGKFQQLPPEQIKTYEYIHSKYADKPKSLDKLQNVWLCGPANCGKSSTVRRKWPDYYDKERDNKWWDGYEGEKVVLIDDVDPRHNKDYNLAGMLKRWADHYPFNGEVKGGCIKNMRPEMIVVTSQYTIEEVFGYDSKAFDAISRRFWEFRWDGQRFVGVQDLEDAFPTASSEAVAPCTASSSASGEGESDDEPDEPWTYEELMAVQEWDPEYDEAIERESRMWDLEFA